MSTNKLTITIDRNNEYEAALELRQLADKIESGADEVVIGLYTDFIAKTEKAFKALGIESDSDLESLNPAVYDALYALLKELQELQQNTVIAQCGHSVELWWYSYNKSTYKDIYKYFF